MMNKISQEPLDRLNETISDILNPQNSRAFSFKAFVKNCIRQFNLAGHLDPNEVINEAYKRAIRAIEKEKIVENWSAWLKSTCLNIIRERSRARKKCSLIDPQSHFIQNIRSHHSIDGPEPSKEEEESKAIQRQINILLQAIEKMEKSDCQELYLLKLRLIDRWSWEQIRDHLLQDSNGDVPNVAALRQRAARAKRKIRRIYHCIEEERVEPAWTERC